jgi:hypothetical protein
VNKLVCLMLGLSIGIAGCSKKETPTSATDVVPPAQAVCSYTVSTTSFNLAGSGASATLTVNTGSTCTWTVANVSPFISVTGVGTQTGPGNVSFSVAENPGDARTGTMTVAGQTVTVNQSANDPVYGNWGGTIAKGGGCPASLPSSVEYTGTIRRTSGATNEFVIMIPAVGVPSQALALTINGSSLQFFVPIDTLYTFNGTLSSDRRSINGTFSGGACSGTWNGTRR